MAIRTLTGLALDVCGLHAAFAERGRAPRGAFSTCANSALDGGLAGGDLRTVGLRQDDAAPSACRARAAAARHRSLGRRSRSRRSPERVADRWRRETVGLVFQQFHLFPGLSALENVLLPLRFDRWSIEPAMRARALKLLERVGVRPDGDVAALSRGEQQRVAVARALLRKPAIVLADEPTASLDRDTARTSSRICSARLCRGANATLVVTTHDPSLASRLDATYDIVDGDLRARSPAAVRAAAALRRVNPLPLVVAELRRNPLGCAAVVALIARGGRAGRRAERAGARVARRERPCRRSLRPRRRRGGQPDAAGPHDGLSAAGGAGTAAGARRCSSCRRTPGVAAVAPVAVTDSYGGYPVGRHDGGFRDGRRPVARRRRAGVQSHRRSDVGAGVDLPVGGQHTARAWHTVGERARVARSRRAADDRRAGSSDRARHGTARSWFRSRRCGRCTPSPATEAAIAVIARRSALVGRARRDPFPRSWSGRVTVGDAYRLRQQFRGRGNDGALSGRGPEPALRRCSATSTTCCAR